MSATADPSFEVATIKPSEPDAKNFGYSWQTRLFQARDKTIADLIRFACQVRQRQIDGVPSWINGLHFEVSGEPNCRNSFNCRRVSLKTKGFLLPLIGRIIPLSIEKFLNL
jgi:uncharacterized protein (TIGR03435 family)